MTTASHRPADVVVARNPKRVAGVIVTGHGFQHMYADGFLVLLPIIQDVFAMGPVALGILSASRQAAGGLLSMGGGFMVDLFAGNRGIFLAGSLFSMGFAYLLAGIAPNAAILIAAVSIGSAAGSFWHPVGLGILSFTFPRDRALLMSLHRSAGSFGEVLTPFIVAAALVYTTWSGVLVGGFFVIAIVSATDPVRTGAAGPAAPGGHLPYRRSAVQEHRRAVHQPRPAGTAHRLRSARHG